MSDTDKSVVLEGCLGQVADLNGLVDYADDAVVSKTILKKQAGTITLFAFDKGQSLSTHSAPFDAVVQVVDGVGVFDIDGKKSTAGVGEILIMPADIPHAVIAEERFKMLLTMVKC